MSRSRWGHASRVHYDGGWPAYVPVSERRRLAEMAMAKLRGQGIPVAPVKIAGRKIVDTFWGKAWCDNLEGYRDYENRLGRGRTYVRNGSVVDLRIAPREVVATVSGSELYQVTVSISDVAEAHWNAICADCAGGIDSVVELLQGRFANGVMERICRRGAGLFPHPAEIRFSCSCPDYASMCKHVAAVLYGVGARLDAEPELLFRLRGVNEHDLVANIGVTLPLSQHGVKAGKVLETDDVAALFGLDMAAAGPSVELGPVPPLPARAGTPPAAADAPAVTQPLHVVARRAARRSPTVAPDVARAAAAANPAAAPDHGADVGGPAGGGHRIGGESASARQPAPAPKQARGRQVAPAPNTASARQSVPVPKRASGRHTTLAPKPARDRQAVPVPKQASERHTTLAPKAASARQAAPVPKRAAERQAKLAPKPTLAPHAVPAPKPAAARQATPAPASASARRQATPVLTPARDRHATSAKQAAAAKQSGSAEYSASLSVRPPAAVSAPKPAAAKRGPTQPPSTAAAPTRTTSEPAAQPRGPQRHPKAAKNIRPESSGGTQPAASRQAADGRPPTRSRRQPDPTAAAGVVP